MTFLTPSATAMALEPGTWKMPIGQEGLPFRRARC